VGLPILVIVVTVTQLLSHFQITVTFSLYDSIFAILDAFSESFPTQREENLGFTLQEDIVESRQINITLLMK
jgi:hypothetical protein